MEHESENHHAGWTQPREFAQSVDRRDTEHIERDRASEQQALVIPRVKRLSVSPDVPGWLQ
jgi:hypothetical protein